MSELMNAQVGCRDIRWQLLTTVSALVLIASAQGATIAKANETDNDRPTVWIEIGGQLERVDGGQDPFAPAFTLVTPGPHNPYKPISPIQAQRAPRYGYGGEGKISLAPKGTDWTISAAIRYGRSNNNKHVHQQTDLGTFVITRSNAPVYSANRGIANFADTKVKNSESHLVFDFMAGKDVGLGLFGRGSSSVVSAGIRFAQLSSASNVALNGRPKVDINYTTRYGFGHIPAKYFDNYQGSAQNTRSFHGIGPSLSWNASTPLVGNSADGEIALDWGMNGAILFGRQKAKGHHQTTDINFNQKYGYYTSPNGNHPYGKGYHAPVRHSLSHDRSRSAVVPNLGGFAGVSFHRGDAKVSLGYRADFFFGAMDSGVDTRHTVNRGFYGPFATINIGLGG